MKIAICDDQQSFVERLCNLITDKEADIHCFHFGNDLLNSEIIFDIVLLDIEMPETDGLSIAYQLYQRSRKTLIVVVKHFCNTTT